MLIWYSSWTLTKVRETLFLRSSIFRTVFSSQHLFFSKELHFQSKISTKQPPLENGYFFKTVTFRNSYLLGGGIAQNKDIYRRPTFSKQVLLHSINFFRRDSFWKKLNFQKSNTLYYLLFMESCLSRASIFSKDLTIYSSWLFRGATFSQHAFLEELLFHSYASFPQLQLLFFSKQLCELDTSYVQ